MTGEYKIVERIQKMNPSASVVGLGFVGKAHLEALRRLGIPVRGILGSSPERTREAVRELKMDRGYSSLEELVNDTSAPPVEQWSTIWWDGASAGVGDTFAAFDGRLQTNMASAIIAPLAGVAGNPPVAVDGVGALCGKGAPC